MAPAEEPARETTSGVAFLEPAPSFGAAHDAGQAGTCGQLTIAHIYATPSANTGSQPRRG